VTDKEKIPTAIALNYDGTSAPHVSALGKGELAEQIIEIAREHNIPLHEDAELTGLLGRLELGDEIPESLYITIARVIAFAYSISGKQAPEVEKSADNNSEGSKPAQQNLTPVSKK